MLPDESRTTWFVKRPGRFVSPPKFGKADVLQALRFASIKAAEILDSEVRTRFSI
jgi:hypothetical protein